MNQRCYLALALFLYVFNGTLEAIAYNPDHPLLAVLLMVKNEEEVMLPTLKPFLDAGIQHYCILDTGSTDNTIEVTRKIFEEYGVQHGHIFEQPFVNFAVTRNYAIDCAQKVFADIPFFLMIDAEWYTQNVEGLLDFCLAHEHDDESIYLMLLQNEGIRNYNNRLFKSGKGLYFAGVVHEYINAVPRSAVPSDVYFYWNPSRLGIEKSRARWQRDLKMLLAEAERDPSDSRTTFYVAQTYECLGDMVNALKWYVRRAGQLGWDQENFIAVYRIGEQFNRLGDWSTAMAYYLKAYGMRPQRIEPLVRIAEHYLALRDFSNAYNFALRAVENAPSCYETLFVDAMMYDYTRYNILGIAAWYTGNYEIGEAAVRKAMLKYPNANHLKYNLSLYEQRKLKA